MSKLTDEWGFFTPMPEMVIKMWPEIGTNAVALFLYLRYRTHKTRGVAFPGYETIREDTGWGYSRVKDAIEKLIDAGLVKCKKRYGKSTEYKLTRPPDVGGTESEDASITETVGLNNPADSPTETVASVLPKQEDVLKTEIKQDSVIEIKDSFSLSQDEWVQVLIAIKQDYYRGRHTAFDQYWGGTGFAGRQDGVFKVSCEKEQQLWLEDNGKKIAENVLVGVLGKAVEVEFIVKESE